MVVENYRWSTVGGHLALDLCNTVSWRLDPARTVDRLADPSRLADWYGTVASPGAGRSLRTWVASAGDDAELALSHVRRLREATTGVVRAHVEGEPAPSRAVAVVAGAVREAMKAVPASRSLPLTWDVDVRTGDDVVHALALAVVDLLADGPRVARLRQCEGEGCGWLFLDTTRNHSRRWCDSTDCGNRARVRAYTARHRPPSPSPTVS